MVVLEIHVNITNAKAKCMARLKIQNTGSIVQSKVSVVVLLNTFSIDFVMIFHITTCKCQTLLLTNTKKNDFGQDFSQPYCLLL